MTMWERRADDGSAAGLEGGIQFSGDLFDRATAEALAARLVSLLGQVAADPGMRASQVDVLSPAERRQVVAGGTTPRHRCPGPGRVNCSAAAGRPDAGRGGRRVW